VEFLNLLLRSRKFWLTVGACVCAAQVGRAEWIPAIIMAEIGAIALEDAAGKVGLHWPQPPADWEPFTEENR
jgi:hypothetical protein